MKIMITGGTGKLGKELVKIFPDSLYPTHKELDITKMRNIYSYIMKNIPEIIIHCAALTNIRMCEENKKLAWKINVEGTKNLINSCIKFNNDCFFIYVSTACIFYGDKGDYVETDIPYPKNFYALTKLLGEFIVKSSSLKKWLIIRTNFVQRGPWPYPKAFIDRFGTYLFADDLAEVIENIINKNMRGILHVCGKDKLSMFELAKIYTSDIKPMTLNDYEGPPLTRDMSLRSIRIKSFKLGK